MHILNIQQSNAYRTAYGTDCIDGLTHKSVVTLVEFVLRTPYYMQPSDRPNGLMGDTVPYLVSNATCGAYGSWYRAVPPLQLPGPTDATGEHPDPPATSTLKFVYSRFELFRFSELYTVTNAFKSATISVI